MNILKKSILMYQEQEEHLKTRITEFEEITTNKLKHLDSESEKFNFYVAIGTAQTKLENNRKALENDKEKILEEARSSRGGKRNADSLKRDSEEEVAKVKKELRGRQNQFTRSCNGLKILWKKQIFERRRKLKI